MKKLMLMTLFVNQLIAFVSLMGLAQTDLNSNFESSSGKKTACAITINSNQEINQFKKYLSPQLWNFVELTQNGSTTDWLEKSCAKKIQCDILVVSGHFGGAFFGSSGIKLTLEKLETNSCQADCSGIVSRPREVFLFGCNTLAGKEHDQRSPEEYQRVLIQDGFSFNQAQQIVAFRYSLLGDSFKSRMSQVFSNTPRIYGFSSKAPIGAEIEADLGSYLRSTRDDYSNFDRYNSRLGTNQNDKFFSALKSRSITQSLGLSLYKNSQIEKPYCYLESREVSRMDKLRYIKSALESGKSLTYLPYIKIFFHNLKMQKKELTEEENNLLSLMRLNPNIRIDFEKLLQLQGDVYIHVRADALKIMKDLLLINEQEYNSKLPSILQLNLAQPVTVEHKDAICSIEEQVDLNFDEIPEAQWNNSVFFNLIGCLKPSSSKIIAKLTDLILNHRDKLLRNRVAYALSVLKPTDANTHSRLIDALVNSKNIEYLMPLAFVISKLKPSSELDQQKILNALVSETNADIKYQLAIALSDNNNLSSHVLTRLKAFLSTENSKVLRSLF